MDGFVIAFPKEHPVVKATKKEKLTEIFQNLLWNHHQVVQSPPYLSVFPLKPHFNKVLHVLVKIHWWRSNVDLFERFLHQRIFVTADCI